MPEDQDQLYNDFADFKALEAQKAKVISIFNDIKKGIKELNDAGISIDKATGLKGLGEGLKKQKKAQDELSLSVDAYNKVLTDNAKLEARIAAMQSEAGKKLAATRVQQQELNKATKEAAKDAAGLTDAYSKLAREYEKAARTAQNLIISKGKDNEETKEAVALANKLGLQLKETDAQVGKFQRNVGNYANSLSGGFELVRREIARLQREQSQLTIGGDTRGAEAAGRRVQELNDVLKVSFDNTKNFDQVVKSLQKSFSTMAANGSQSNEFLQDFKKFTAEAKDQAEDLKQEIKALSSDTRKLDLAAGSVNFLADSLQLAAGTAQLFGASEEEANKATARLVAIQSVANGLKGIANELTTKGTAANKLYTFSLAQLSIATDASASALTRLRAVLFTLGIGALIVGVGLLVANFDRLKNAFSGISEEQRKMNGALIEGAKNAAVQRNNLDALYKAATTTAKGIDAQKNAAKELQKTYPLTFANFTTEEILLGKAKRGYEELSKSILANSILKAKQAVIDKNAVDFAEEEQKIDIKIAELRKQQQKASTSRREIIGDEKSRKITYINDKEEIETEIQLLIEKKNRKKKVFDEENKNFADSIAEDKRIAELANKEEAERIKRENDALNKGKNKSDTDFSDRSRKAAIEAKKIQLEAAAAIQKEIVDIESFSYADRVNALNEYIRIKTDIINADAEYEKSKKGLTAEELNLIEAKRLDDIQKLSDDARKQLAQSAGAAVQAVAEETAEVVRELTAEEQSIIDAFEKKELDKLLNFLGILTDAQKKAIEIIEQSFNEADIATQIKDTYIDAFQSIASSGIEILGGFFENQKGLIQQQIDEIERLKAAEIERINASGDNEEKKAARIKIIESKAQADREALERKQRQLDRQKAIAAKALNVFQTTIDGLQAVNKQKLIVAEIIAKMAAAGPAGPALFGPSLALAKATLFGTIATSALAVVAAAAAPIPKFFKGKKASDPYAGPGIVGDQGPELGIDPKGNLTYYTKPTLTHLTKGTTILPADITRDIMRASAFSLPAAGAMLKERAAIDYSDKLDKQTEILKRMERKQHQTNVYNIIDMSPYVYYHMKK